MSWEGPFILPRLESLWRQVEIGLESDSTAAIGTVRRLGPGKRLRHVEVELFFLQQLVKQGVVTITKKDGKQHPPDLLTKHLGWPDLKRLLRMLDVEILTAAGLSLLTGAEAKSPTDEDEKAMTTMTTRIGELVKLAYNESTNESYYLGIVAVVLLASWALTRLGIWVTTGLGRRRERH